MRDLNETNVTEAVLGQMHAEDPRLQTVLESLVRHLHAFIREVELTEGEWFDYDEKAGEEVSIKDITWEIVRA